MVEREQSSAFWIEDQQKTLFSSQPHRTALVKSGRPRPRSQEEAAGGGRRRLDSSKSGGPASHSAFIATTVSPSLIRAGRFAHPAVAPGTGSSLACLHGVSPSGGPT